MRGRFSLQDWREAWYDDTTGGCGWIEAEGGTVGRGGGGTEVST